MIDVGAGRRRRKQAEQRNVHRAEVPEELEERRLRGSLARDVADQLEGFVAVEEVLDRGVRGGEVVDQRVVDGVLEVQAAQRVEGS